MHVPKLVLLIYRISSLFVELETKTMLMVVFMSRQEKKKA